MKFIVHPSRIGGVVDIPGSKSHTIRALVFGLLAGGESVIERPLDSSDTRSCLEMVRRFGAEVDAGHESWTVRGGGGDLPVPEDIIDVGNSGTSLYIGIGLASLVDGFTVFTGDGQTRNRPAGSLLRSIEELGGRAWSTRGNGKPPLVVGGRIRGGTTSIEAVTSQYLTALLIAAPCARGDTVIRVPLLNEAPYVEMTLAWMEKLGVSCVRREMKEFRIRGGQSYHPFRESVPADFSSAAFFLVAAAITGAELVLRGLDPGDTQGDREVLNILRDMGAGVETGERHVRIRGGKLRGGTFDLNAIPDALPALAVAGCFAEGETRLVNVPQARLKETDRISVMRAELAAMGADIEELPDGLVIRGSALRGAKLRGHGDHRVVMSLAVAGLMAEGTTEIDTAESVAVTFPGFLDLMKEIKADITCEKER